MFVIDDELHAEQMAESDSFGEAIEQLKDWSTVPWDQPPHRAPCEGWRDCGRRYEIVEYDDKHVPWRELSRVHVLDVSKSGAQWLV